MDSNIDVYKWQWANLGKIRSISSFTAIEKISRAKKEIIAFLTISYHAILAAIRNPVESLRYE